MLKALFEIFLLYILYVIIFDFIIPLYKTTKTMREKMGEMQQKMNQQERQQNQNNTAPKQSSVSGNHDYIDYEEVK